MSQCLLRQHSVLNSYPPQSSIHKAKFRQVSMSTYKALLISPCPPLPFDRIKPEGPCDPRQANQSLSSRDVQVGVWETQWCRLATQLLGQQPHSSLCFGEQRKPYCRKGKIKQMGGERWVRVYGKKERGKQTHTHKQTPKYELHCDSQRRQLWPLVLVRPACPSCPGAPSHTYVLKKQSLYLGFSQCKWVFPFVMKRSLRHSSLFFTPLFPSPPGGLGSLVKIKMMLTNN